MLQKYDSTSTKRSPNLGKCAQREISRKVTLKYNLEAGREGQDCKGREISMCMVADTDTQTQTHTHARMHTHKQQVTLKKQ